MWRSHSPGTPTGTGCFLRDYHSRAIHSSSWGKGRTGEPRDCCYSWEITRGHIIASYSSSRPLLTTACSWPFHSCTWHTRGPDYTSPGTEHLSSSYSSTSLDRWGGCSDSGYTGSISGLLNSWWFFFLDNDYNYISFSTLFLVILIYVYILMFFFVWIVSMHVLKHIEQFYLIMMIMQWNTFIFVWKLVLWIDFGLNAWLWWSLCFFS